MAPLDGQEGVSVVFYVLSKVVYFCVAPSHLCLLALALGVILLAWRSTARLARRFLIASLLGFTIFGFTPLGNVLLLPLENRFAPPDSVRPGEYRGIIMLGGFEDGDISRARNTLALIDAGERLSETVRLANMLPDTKIIFTGGAASVFLRYEDARDAVGAYLRDVGIASQRIVLEGGSRNTWENAVFTKRLLQPAEGARYLLVTSAWHMPRAYGVFRKAGFDVDPYPVDYRTQGNADLTRPFSLLTNGLKRMDRAVREWIGLAAYWLSGRSSALFPGPDQ